jgi:hypothetical protein
VVVHIDGHRVHACDGGQQREFTGGS